MRRRACLAVILAAVMPPLVTTGAARPAGASDRALRIGLLPERNLFEQVERHEALASYLARELGRPVRLTVLSRYGSAVDRIRHNDMSVAFLGSFTGALASSRLAMEPVARPVNLDGTSTYSGYIFTRRDSGIRSVADMRGTRLALVERATTAGYVFPLAYVRRGGIKNLEAYFKQVDFWGSHDAAVHAVLEGRADVGAAKNTVYDEISRADVRVREELRVLAASPPVPSNALFVSSSTDATRRDRLRTLLLAIHESPEGRAVLARLGVRRFVPTTREEYTPVLALAREAGLDIAAHPYRNE